MRSVLQFIVLCIFINSHLYAKASPSTRNKRNAYKDRSRHWPNGIVYYTIDPSFSHEDRTVIYKGMNRIQSVSCIRFKKRSYQKGYIEIKKGDGCSAVVGYWGEAQSLTLGRGCVNVPTVIHELFHSLGFFHEHARPDRDNFIRVHDHHIKPNNVKNYHKKNPNEVTSLGLPYDYGSVLHYKDEDFAIDSRKTMTSIRGNQVLGRAKGMSKLDIWKLNILYRCRWG